MSRTMQFLARHSAGATSIVVFVAFAVAGTAIVGQVGPRHHGDDDCEWNEFGEVVCPDPTNTPTNTPTPTHAPK